MRAAKAGVKVELSILLVSPLVQRAHDLPWVSGLICVRLRFVHVLVRVLPVFFVFAFVGFFVLPGLRHEGLQEEIT